MLDLDTEVWLPYWKDHSYKSLEMRQRLSTLHSEPSDEANHADAGRISSNGYIGAELLNGRQQYSSALDYSCGDDDQKMRSTDNLQQCQSAVDEWGGWSGKTDANCLPSITHTHAHTHARTHTQTCTHTHTNIHIYTQLLFEFYKMPDWCSKCLVCAHIFHRFLVSVYSDT